jgi:hypothetical protein
MSKQNGKLERVELLPFAEELAVACFPNKISHFDEQLCVSNISPKTQ